jgi:dimethylamine monooxygenase subunit A
VPHSGAVLFTIRTHVTPLRDAICDFESAEDLALAVRTMPDDVARYRGMRPFRGALLEWLEVRASR